MDLTSVGAVNTTHVWAVGTYGGLLYTADGGDSWRTVEGVGLARSWAAVCLNQVLYVGL